MCSLQVPHTCGVQRNYHMTNVISSNYTMPMTEVVVVEVAEAVYAAKEMDV